MAFAILFGLSNALLSSFYVIWKKKSLKDQNVSDFNYTLFALIFIYTIIWLVLVNFLAILFPSIESETIFKELSNVTVPISSVIFLLIATRIIDGINHFLHSHGIKFLPVSYIAPSRSLVPLFIFVLSIVFSRIDFTSHNLVGFLVAFLGIIMLNGNLGVFDKSLFKERAIPALVFVTLPAFLVSLVYVMEDIAIKSSINFITFLFWSRLFLTSSNGAISGISNSRPPKLILSKTTVITSMIGFFVGVTYYAGLKTSNVVLMSIIRRMDVIFAVFWGGTLLKEAGYKKTILISLIISIGIVLMSLG